MFQTPILRFHFFIFSHPSSSCNTSCSCQEQPGDQRTVSLHCISHYLSVQFIFNPVYGPRLPFSTSRHFDLGQRLPPETAAIWTPLPILQPPSMGACNRTCN